MDDAWFSIEVARSFRWLAFTAFLSFLAAAPMLGRLRALVTGVWAAGIVIGVAALVSCGVAVLADQPSHVVRPLFVLGLAYSIAFGVAFLQMRLAYSQGTSVRSA